MVDRTTSTARTMPRRTGRFEDCVDASTPVPSAEPAVVFRPADESASEAGVVPDDVPAPEAVVVVVVVVVVVDGGGGGVVADGRSTLSIETAVPEAQFTGLPPIACQVLPVTWMLSAG
jgi:hypothetical protein